VDLLWNCLYFALSSISNLFILPTHGKKRNTQIQYEMAVVAVTVASALKICIGDTPRDIVCCPYIHSALIWNLLHLALDKAVALQWVHWNPGNNPFWQQNEHRPQRN
jgi:hypothetical protein